MPAESLGRSGSSASNSCSLHQFLDLYALPAVQLSRDGVQLYANQAFLQQHAWTRHEAQLGQRLKESQTARRLHTSTSSSDEFIEWALTPLSADVFVFTALSVSPGASGAKATSADPTLTAVAATSQSKPAPEDWTQLPRFARIAHGGGEMGDRVRKFDWSQTELGPLHTWSQSLVDMVGFCLHSPLPATAYIGPHALVVYNDAYIPVIGRSKHPALGKPGRVVWKEILQHIDQPLWDCYKHGKMCLATKHQLFFDRIHDPEVGCDGALEEVHATWAYEPWFGADHRPIGVMHKLFETTGLDTITGRRLEVITTLGSDLASQGNLFDLCRAACKSMSTLDRDLPYCVAYTCSPRYNPDDEGVDHSLQTFILQDTVGCPFDSGIAPVRLPVNPDEAGLNPSASTSSGAHFWQDHLDKMCRTKTPVNVTGFQNLLDGLPLRGFFTPRRAVMVPLLWQGAVVGCFIFLLSPALPYNEGSDLHRFVNILDRQLNFGVQAVRNFEFEVQRREELAALDKAKTSFFTSVSHELRTPLTLILGPLSELCKDKSLAPPAREQISMVSRNARRLLRLVNSILDFARCEAGKMKYIFERVEIGPYTSELVRAFKPLCSSVSLDCRLSENTVRLVAWLDIDKYEKIISNLIGNALKFTRQGSITITVEANEHEVTVAVADTGLGIPTEELGNIFDKFHRVENPLSRSIEGSGIGLSLTMELVKAHGGKLTVESAVSQGSTFKVVIPLGNEHLPKQALSTSRDVVPATKPDSFDIADFFDTQPKTSSMSTSSSDGEASDPGLQLNFFGDNRKPTVLIADDNDDMRVFIKSILQSKCKILEAENGQQALDIVRKGGVDLLLSDIQMPQASGFEVLAQIREDPQLKNMVVILLSARAGEEASVEGLASGADDYLSKPFSPKELILRVNQHLQLLAVRTELETRVQERTSALEASKRSFQRLSELLQVGVHRSDPSGKIVWANRKWHQTLCLTEGTRDAWDVMIHPNDRARAEKAYMTAVATGQGYKDPIEMRLVGGSGSSGIDITYDLQAETDEEGNCTGFVGVFSDVTALRRLERERVDLERGRREEAEKNRSMQEEFIDSICHELRNPMQAIVALAELLGESLLRLEGLLKKMPAEHLPQEWEDIQGDIKDDLDAVSTIILCSRHQKRIADDVLHVSKLSGNLISLSENEFVPAQAVSNSVKMFALEISAKSVNLSLSNHPSCQSFPGRMVIGDDGRFQQIAVNLLANAIKFSENSKARSIKVKLGLSRASTSRECVQSVGEYDPDSEMLPMCESLSAADLAPGSSISVWMAVADSGPGMALEEQSRIFERFVQASPKTYREFGGVGLGLYISRKLVELQGGRIFLHSAKGVGTIFRFYVNVKVSSNTEVQPVQYPALGEMPSVEQVQVAALSFSGEILPDAAKTRPSVTANGGIKPEVLVVEDNKINQKVLCRLLHDLGWTVITANDGLDCLRQVDERLRKKPTDPPYDMILMDLEMPVMDGMTATQRLRELERKGKWSKPQVIVAVTANARQMFEEQAKAIGMDGFLRKPYSKSELFACLEHHVKR